MLTGGSAQTEAAQEWDVRCSSTRGLAPDHLRRNLLMLLETFGLSFLLTVLAAWALQHDSWVLAGLLALPRGLWIQRHYCVGHEAAHGKLFPGHPLANALWGQLALLALLTPLPVFRKIHQFHHGHNRRDLKTSALEVIWISTDSRWRRLGAWCQWLFAVFACGWFWHGLLSIVLFLTLPRTIAVRVSPAFRGWSTRERVLSWGAFGLGLSVHILCWRTLGFDAWWWLFGAPLLVFSWSYSAQLYIYHYDSSIGPNVTRHARALGGSLVNWWLLSLNEHDTHHQRPAIVWYALRDLAHTRENPRRSFVWGLKNQLRGPRIVVRAEKR